MTLQQLIGELQTLALAYPDTTPIKAQMHDFHSDVVGLSAESIGDDLVITIATQ